ncbi:MAG: hypothetical protein DRH20_14550 [Deltaproteobacteria bacterium]|nr:MAG: hypothetical protein DRH20_14550 [Deltaproteobacteria bacterium]
MRLFQLAAPIRENPLPIRPWSTHVGFLPLPCGNQANPFLNAKNLLQISCKKFQNDLKKN